MAIWGTESFSKLLQLYKKTKVQNRFVEFENKGWWSNFVFYILFVLTSLDYFMNSVHDSDQFLVD